MPSSAEAVCATSAPIEHRLEPAMLSPVLWIPEPVEIPALRIRFRAVAWGVLLSVVLWASAILAGRALWMLWR